MDRINQSLEQFLHIYKSNNQSDQTTFLPIAELAYNTTTYDVTNISLIKVCFGQEPSLFPEIESIPQDPISSSQWVETIKHNHLLEILHFDWTCQSIKKQADKGCKKNQIKTFKYKLNRLGF